METSFIRVWDLPTRIFHWGLVLSVFMSIATGLLGGEWMIWHGRLGLALVGLTSFRIIWGFFGSTYVLFKKFWPSLSNISTYLHGEWQDAGHNPLGAVSVITLLTVLVFQVFSGLFANDGLTFNGYLYPIINNATSEVATRYHRYAANLLYTLIVLHIGAISFYYWVKHKNLVKPMITGFTRGESHTSAKGGGILPFISAFIIACFCVYLASGEWLRVIPQERKYNHQFDL